MAEGHLHWDQNEQVQTKTRIKISFDSVPWMLKKTSTSLNQAAGIASLNGGSLKSTVGWFAKGLAAASSALFGGTADVLLTQVTPIVLKNTLRTE